MARQCPTDTPTLERGIELREAGLYVESARVLERLIKRLRLRLGPFAFQTLCVQSQLGRTLRSFGKVDQAAALHWYVLAARLAIHGANDSFTTNSAGILADTLAMGGDDPTADLVRRWRDAQPHPLLGADPALAQLTAQLESIFAAASGPASTAFVNRLVRRYLLASAGRRCLQPQFRSDEVTQELLRSA